MDLSRLPRPTWRTWSAPLALASLMVALQAWGDAQGLRYERGGVLDGELWRLATGHLVHADTSHLAWNLAGLALVAWLFAPEFGRRAWLGLLAASTAAVDLGFLVLEPQLEWYVGFSGVLHGLMAAGLLRWLARARDGITAVVAVAFVAKIAWEQLVGPVPFTSQTLAVPVVYEAHTYGAIGGALAAALAQWRPSPRAASL